MAAATSSSCSPDGADTKDDGTVSARGRAARASFTAAVPVEKVKMDDKNFSVGWRSRTTTLT
jgi:hypothetical protein